LVAGEVVQRPASVVKRELLETPSMPALRKCSYRERSRRKQLVQVDNAGMSPTDALHEPERHATSKISSTEDLFRIRTLVKVSIASPPSPRLRFDQAARARCTGIAAVGRRLRR
jgi:hypothetical protein